MCSAQPHGAQPQIPDPAGTSKVRSFANTARAAGGRGAAATQGCASSLLLAGNNSFAFKIIPVSATVMKIQ